MSVMDKNGRLFGRINIVDATIIILSVAIAMIYAGIVRKTASVKDAYKTEVIKIYKLVKEDDKARDHDMGFYGVLEKIKKIGEKEIKLEDETLKEVDVMVWIRAKVNVDGDLILYRYGGIRPGGAFGFESETYNLHNGEIIEIIRNE
jgi:hypothetical protein